MHLRRCGSYKLVLKYEINLETSQYHFSTDHQVWRHCIIKQHKLIILTKAKVSWVHCCLSFISCNSIWLHCVVFIHTLRHLQIYLINITELDQCWLSGELFFGVVLFQNISLNSVSVITNRSLLACTCHCLYHWGKKELFFWNPKSNFFLKSIVIIFVTILVFIISCCVPNPIICNIFKVYKHVHTTIFQCAWNQ